MGATSRKDQGLIAQWTDIVSQGDAKVFQKLADRLADFPDLAIETDDYVQAAVFFNTCRAHGVTGSAIDLLLCATAWRHDVPILTTDSDFVRYGRLLPIALLEHRPRGS